MQHRSTAEGKDGVAVVNSGAVVEVFAHSGREMNGQRKERFPPLFSRLSGAQCLHYDLLGV